MSLRPLYGHAALRHRLTAAAAEDRLPASLMLQGRRGVGKQRLGLWLGQYLLCERALSERLLEPCGDCQHCRYTGRGIHPDLHWFFPRPRLKDGDASPDDVKADYSEAIAERMDWKLDLYKKIAPFLAPRAIVVKGAISPARVRAINSAQRVPVSYWSMCG